MKYDDLLRRYGYDVRAPARNRAESPRVRQTARRPWWAITMLRKLRSIR